MRRLVLFCIMLLFIECINAQVIINPVFDKTNNPRLRIEKVEITSDTTFIYCTFFKSEYCDSCILFSDLIQLEDIDTKYLYSIINSCDLSSNLGSYYRKKMYYIRYSFPHIPLSHKYNLSYYYLGRSLYIYGINLQETYKKIYSISDIDYASEQADILISENKISLAIKERERELESSKYVYGYRSKETALVYYYLASLHFKLKNFTKAIELGEKGLELDKERTDGNSLQAIWSDLNNLSHFYYEAGDYSKAIEYEEILLKKVQYVNGDNRERLATVLTNLSKFNNSLGNYNLALKYAEQALTIKKDLSLSESESYAITLSNLATAKSNLGDYEEAISINKECCRIFTSFYGPSYISNTIPLQNIAYNYGEMGKYKEAIIYGEMADSLFKYHSVVSQNFISNLLNLSLCYLNLATIELTEESDSLFKKYIDYSNEAEYYALQMENSSSLLPGILNNIAYSQHVSGHIKEAFSTMERACKLSNNNTMEAYAYYQNLEHMYLESGYYESALIIQHETLPHFFSRIRDNFSLIPINSIKSYWNSKSINSWLYHTIPQCAFLTRDSEAVSELYNTLLLSKGFLLNSELNIKKSILEEGDSSNISYMDRLAEIEKSIYEKYKNVKDSSIVRELKKEFEECEGKLISNSQAYKNYISHFENNWKQVQKHLNGKDVAIEFVKFSIKDKLLYSALLLKKDYITPKYIFLFSEDEYNESLTQEEKYNLIWKPIENELRNVTNIYFSPDGLLYCMGIEYLSNIQDKYNIYRLSSTKELINSKSNSKFTTAALFGGIEYDSSLNREKGQRSRASNKQKKNLQRSTFEQLDNTLLEIQQISSVLKYGGIDVRDYTSRSGSENNFRDLTKNKANIIHIATHGMYVEKENAAKIKENQNYLFINNNNSLKMSEETALTRSFLVMAGGNQIAKHIPSVENDNDGILTAFEISQLTFTELDLVVLSACQTGLGDINNEGVIGLQRGFKKAGAQTILMSLDKVDDEATKLLMVEFYRNLMSGKTKRQSLQEAQQYLRKVDNGKYDDPKFWASFIMLDGLN